MSTGKHAPGPWEIAETQRGTMIKGQPCGYLAEVRKCFSREENVANAHLIAAAPDLLAALNDCVRCIEINCERRAPDANDGRGVASADEQVALEMARGAIAKANEE